MVILGGSGSGKSTLLRSLVGLQKPSGGEIWLRGKNIAAISNAEMDEIRKKIGMSFQGSALFGSLTVGENVALPLREHTDLEDSHDRHYPATQARSGWASRFRRLHAVGAERRNEEAGLLWLVRWRGPGNTLFRRAFCRALDPIIAAGVDQLILELKKGLSHGRSSS